MKTQILLLNPGPFLRKKGASLGQICSRINFFLSDEVLYQPRSCSLIPLTASYPLLLPPSQSPPGLPSTQNKENVLTSGRNCTHPWPRLELCCYPTGDLQTFLQDHSLCILFFWNNTYRQSLYNFLFVSAREFHHVFSCTSKINPIQSRNLYSIQQWSRWVLTSHFVSHFTIYWKHIVSISTTCLLCLVSFICLPHSQLHIIFHTAHYTCKSFPLPCKAILFITFQPQNLHWHPLFVFSSSWVMSEIPDYLKAVLKGLIIF